MNTQQALAVPEMNYRKMFKIIDRLARYGSMPTQRDLYLRMRRTASVADIEIYLTKAANLGEIEPVMVGFNRKGLAIVRYRRTVKSLSPYYDHVHSVLNDPAEQLISPHQHYTALAFVTANPLATRIMDCVADYRASNGVIDIAPDAELIHMNLEKEYSFELVQAYLVVLWHLGLLHRRTCIGYSQHDGPNIEYYLPETTPEGAQ